MLYFYVVDVTTSCTMLWRWLTTHNSNTTTSCTTQIVLHNTLHTRLAQQVVWQIQQLCERVFEKWLKYRVWTACNTQYVVQCCVGAKQHTTQVVSV